MPGIKLWIPVLLLLAPAIFASSLGDVELADSLGDIGNMIEDILRNDDAMFALVFVILYILFYSLLKMLLATVPLFGESKPARTIAGAISLLAVIGLFWQGKTIIDNAAGIAGGLGPLTLILAGIILFGGITKKTNLKWGGFVAGGLMVAAGIFFESPWLFPVGLLFIILGVLKTTANAGNPYTHPNASPGRKRRWARNALGGLGKLASGASQALKDNQTIQNSVRSIIPRAKKKEEIENDLRWIDKNLMNEMHNVESMIQADASPEILRDRISRLIKGIRRQLYDCELLKKEDDYEMKIFKSEAKQERHDLDEQKHDMHEIEQYHIESQEERELERTESKNVEGMDHLEHDLKRISKGLRHEKRDLNHIVNKIRSQLDTLNALYKMIGTASKRKVMEQFHDIGKEEKQKASTEEAIEKETHETESELEQILKDAKAEEAIDQEEIKEVEKEEEDLEKL
ncbi:MAG: hypothetical protein ACLFP2_01665 [Candidatus Woesearchaeota archaeon]